MERIKGYRLAGGRVGDSKRPDIHVLLGTGVEIRRDSSTRDADEFRAEMTLDEAQQLYVALGELLPKAAKTATEETTTFP